MRREIAVRLARWWLRRRIARDLDGQWVAGIERTRTLVSAGPVLLAANHVGWWDGPCLLLADDAIGGHGHFVLDAASLDRFPFFGALGAIALDRGSALRMRAGMRAARAALERGTVWFFPQGRERPSWVRPLGLQQGHHLLGKHATVVPVAIAYAFAGAPRPRAYFHFGRPAAPADLEAALVEGLAAIDRAIEGSAEGFAPLVPARGSRPDWGLGTRLLGLLVPHA